MNQPASQLTLRELARPIIEHRLLLLIVIALAVGASVAYSATKKPVYQAQAAVAYQDQTYDLGLVGLGAPATQTPDQLASAGAQTIIQPAVAARVHHQLKSPSSVEALLGSVSAAVQPNSNLVVIQASAANAADARRLANAFAAQGAAATNAQIRDVYKAEYRAASAQLRRSGTPASADSQDLGRLQVLGAIATSAQVVKPADLPSSPSSPRPARDAAIAAVLGLVLGLLAVYVRDALDRRLKSAGDVEEEFGFPMIGHVRTEALGQSPRANGNGNVQATDWELFRILRRNLDFLTPDSSVRSVAVTSSLPEEGKSTVASFLAFTSAAAGKRTVLLEADLRRPTLAQRLGANRFPGLSDYALGRARLQDIQQVIPFGEPISGNGFSMNGNGNGAAAANGTSTGAAEAKGTAAVGVRHGTGSHMHELTFISAGTPTKHAVEILRSEALSRIFVELTEMFDLVVVDTPPLLSVADTLELLPQVESAVVCVRVFSTTRQQAGAGKAALKRLPDVPTGLVVTGTRRSSEADYGYYGYYS